eukprot:TRINITY_DN8121_c0_g1_i8.p1 TRINITY_DN8121_c0_g1~~TRINITY_DN8121_c0_g1_i8.p1  ORF type:complete len:469 (-),score=64.10 TRINITY_DN8121_c0_g1_i8:35-1441(-)
MVNLVTFEQLVEDIDWESRSRVFLDGDREVSFARRKKQDVTKRLVILESFKGVRLRIGHAENLLADVSQLLTLIMQRSQPSVPSLPCQSFCLRGYPGNLKLGGSAMSLEVIFVYDKHGKLLTEDLSGSESYSVKKLKSLIGFLLKGIYDGSKNGVSVDVCPERIVRTPTSFAFLGYDGPSNDHQESQLRRAANIILRAVEQGCSSDSFILGEDGPSPSTSAMIVEKLGDFGKDICTLLGKLCIDATVEKSLAFANEKGFILEEWFFDEHLPREIVSQVRRDFGLEFARVVEGLLARVNLEDVKERLQKLSFSGQTVPHINQPDIEDPTHDEFQAELKEISLSLSKPEDVGPQLQKQLEETDELALSVKIQDKIDDQSFIAFLKKEIFPTSIRKLSFHFASCGRISDASCQHLMEYLHSADKIRSLQLVFEKSNKISNFANLQPTVFARLHSLEPVSYTHLTLPTIYSV